MKVTVDLYALGVKEPKQDERVMVWITSQQCWYPQVFNKECNCWDTEDGDDYECDLNPQDIWFSLPSNPNNL